MPAEMIPVASSMISAIGYDDEQQELTIQFNNGREYSYGGVPASEFDNLRSAQSVGKYFAANIKGVYREA